jgi:uncharacterized membrane protein (UPF0136 family)
MAHHLAFSSAGLLTGLGVYAYVSKGSKASLIGSSALAAGLATSGYLCSKTDHVFAGHALGAAAGAGALGIGASRMKKGGGTVPMVLCGVGAINLGYQSFKTWEWKDS